MFIAPEKYAVTPVGDLLDAAALGHLGLDQRWLTGIVNRRGEAIPELVRWGLDDRSGDYIDLTEDLVCILHHLATPQALPVYIKVLRAELLEPPEYLVEAFVALGPASIEPLLALYQELDEAERTEIAFLLAALRVHDPRVLALLLARLNRRLWDGAFCLSVYGDPAARPAIEKQLAEQPDNPELRQTLEGLDRPALPVSPVPFELFAQYPERATPDLEVLSVDERLEMLASEVEEYRSASAASFFHEDLSEPVVTALFAAARDDSSATVRARAWEALSAELERADIRDAVLARVNDPAAPLEERCGALVAIAQVAEPAVHARILEFYDIPEARAKALEAMWRSLDPAFGRYFPLHLDDRDREVCRQAIRGAGFCELHAEVGRLRQLWNDEDLRGDALFAYALAMPGVTSPAHLRALLGRIDKEAGGLDEDDEELVKMALDERLRLHGLDPFFFPDADEDDDEPVEKAPPPAKVGRNDPCPCGSGKKYKKCCGA